MADMKLEMGWMKYVEMLEIAESRGVPAQFDAELCGLIAKSIRHKEATIEAQGAEIKRLREALEEIEQKGQYAGDMEDDWLIRCSLMDAHEIAQAALAGGE